MCFALVHSSSGDELLNYTRTCNVSGGAKSFCCKTELTVLHSTLEQSHSTCTLVTGSSTLYEMQFAFITTPSAPLDPTIIIFCYEQLTKDVLLF